MNTKRSFMIAPVLAAVSFLALFPATAFSDEEKTVRREVSYLEYLARIRESLPEIRKNALAVDRARNTLRGTGSAEDINLEGTASYGKTTRYASNPFSRPGYEKNYTADMGLTRKIIESGTTLSAGVGYTRNSPNINYGDYDLPPAYHYPSYYLGFSQSVLKNAFGVVDRYASKDAGMKLEIEKLRNSENNKSTLNPYKKLYFDWIEYARRLELLNKSVDNARSLLEQVNRKFRTGLAENDDVQNATATLLQHRTAYEESLAEYNAMLRRLSVYIDSSGLTAAEEEFDRYFKKAADDEFPLQPFEETRAADIYRLTKKNRNYAKSVAGNKLLPQLDITGKYTRKAQDDDLASAMGGMSDTDYYIGFSVSYPLGNSMSESERREAEIAVAEVNHEYDISKNDYRKSVESLRESAVGLRRVIELTEQRIRALESKYSTERKKYLQARMDLNFLISTANALTSEKMNLQNLKKQLIYLYVDYGDLTE